MTKVMLMTLLILIPMSWAVSKSLLTARMAMPILVWLMSHMRPMTSRMVSTGVKKVTREAETSPIWKVCLSTEISG